MALAYETAAEHLEDAVRQQGAFSEHLESAAGIMRRVPEATSFGQVAERLAPVSGELGHALAAGAAVVPSLEQAGSHLAASAEKGLIGVLDDLIEEVAASVAAVADIQTDVDAESATAAASGQAAGRSGGAGQDPASPVDAVNARIAELRRQGHAPQRHGPQVTDEQLTARALYGIDPITGTTTDGETGGPHNYSRNATKFTSEEALVAAEASARTSDSFRDQEIANTTSGLSLIYVEESLEKVYGPEYLEKVKGIRRTGTRAKPTGDPPGALAPTITDFTDGTVLTMFRKGQDGQYLLTTAFPQPKDI